MFIRVCGGRKKSEKFVSTKGTITITSNISGVGIKVVSGTAVYTAGTAEGTSFTTPKLANGTYEVVVSKDGYEDVVVPVVVDGDTDVSVELKTAALAVESVKAINAKQIEVKFNHVMDRATVEKNDNYKIEPINKQDVFPTENNIKDITLQDDAKTAIITVGKTSAEASDDDNIKMINGYEYEVTVRKEIKSAAGKELTDKSVTKIISNDSTRPVTTEIKTLTPSLLQVTFSEPVIIKDTYQVLGNNIEFVTVDSTGKELDDVLNKVVRGSSVLSTSNNKTSYIIKLDSNLKQGSNYNLYVGGGNGIADYAGLKLTAEKHTFAYEADKEVTTVKNFTLLDGKTAKVTFTKPIDVKRKGIEVYYNNDGVQGNIIASGKVKEFDDAQSIKVEFDKLIPAGSKYFFVDGVYDLAENKVEIGRFNVTVPEYKTAEVSSVKLANKTTIEVVFNQDIDDEKSYFKKDDLTHNNKVRANIVLKDKDGKSVDIKDIQPGKNSKEDPDYTKRVITLYNDLGEGNNTLTIENLVDELGRAVTAYKGTVSYASSTEFSAKLKAGKSEDDDKTVAVLSIDESKVVPTQASVENLKNWTVDTIYGKKTLAEVSGAKVKMVSNDVYIVEADKDAFKADSAVVLSNLQTAAGLTIPSTTVVAGDKVNDIKSLAEAKGDMSFDGTTATINLKNLVIGSFSSSDFILSATKTDGNPVTANDYTVSYSNDTAKDAFASKIVVKLNNNVKLNTDDPIALKTAARTSTTDIFGRKLQAGAAISIMDTTKAAVTGAYIANTDNTGATININLNKYVTIDGTHKLAPKDFTVVTKDSKQTINVDNATIAGKVLTITLEDISQKLYKDVLEKEEVTVSFTKKLTTADVASTMSATTNSLRLTKVAFGAGKSAEKLEGDETITFTYNKTLNQDLLKDVNQASAKVVVTADASQKIETELGSFVVDTGKLFKDSVDIPAKYEISGNTVKITLSAADTNEVVPTDPNAWENLAVSYSNADAATGISQLTLAKVQALDGTFATVSTNDSVINDASKLTTGDIISYASIESAIKAYEDSLKVFMYEDDVKAAKVAQKNAKDAIAKASSATAEYYTDSITDDDTAFINYSKMFDVYTTLKPAKLQAILNDSAITSLPKTGDTLESTLTGNDATIRYYNVDSNSEITEKATLTTRPAEGVVKVKVTIASSDKTQDVYFTVTIPATGDITVK
ncbi:MAG: hypothetical protein MR409_01545 [Lachnospiraceae bacterium]|nr:hypothetical protein [Lachnospiraceae bacterium]